LDSSSVHHREYFTVHTAMVYVIPVCGQLASRIKMELSSILILLASCQQTGMTYSIAVCIVKYSWWWTGELSDTWTFSFQNKIEKLVHLASFITQNLSGCTVTWTSNINSSYISLGLKQCWPCYMILCLLKDTNVQSTSITESNMKYKIENNQVQFIPLQNLMKLY